MPIRLFWIQLFLLIFSFSSFTQNYRFHILSPEGGFNYDGVSSIKQDALGFMWIQMDNDLYRFDGYEYINYNHHFHDQDFFPGWSLFRDIMTDTLGQLYVQTHNKLHMYQPENNAFEPVLDTTIINVMIDPLNNIWIRTPVLHLFDPVEKEIIPITYDGKPFNSSISLIWNIEDRIFVATSVAGHIYTVDIATRSLTLYGLLPKNKNYTCMQFRNNELWAMSGWSYLYSIDFQTLSIKKEYDFFMIPGKQVKDIYTDKFGDLWIASQGGIFIFNPETEEYTYHNHSKFDPFSLPDNSVWTIAEDRQRNVWLGTYSGGVCYVNLDERNYFRSYTHRRSPLNHHVVSGFAEDDRTVWIATEGGGINCLDKNTGEFSYITRQLNANNSLAHDHVKNMVFDGKRQKLWISMFWGGLDCYDLEKKNFTHFVYKGGNNSLKDNNLRKIVQESDSGLWITYQSLNMLFSFYSFERNRFEHFVFSDDNSFNGHLWDIYRDHGSDRLWIQTYRKLYVMDVKKRSVEEVPMNIILNGRVLYAEDQYVWIGTTGKGLVRYSLTDSTYHVFDDILKFKASSIYSICADNNKNLWMGTDNGLFKFDIGKHWFTRFDENDGIHGSVFYPLASMKSQSGELYFGGTNGFTVVNYQEPSLANAYEPNAMVSDILVDQVSLFSDTVKFKWNPFNAAEKEIILTHQQSNVGFKFSSDNYLNSSKNRYRYRLMGYNTQWTEVDAANRIAFYTKLPAGRYTFEVLSSNNEGVWGTTPTQVHIRRLPAPWFSWWAYSFYSMVLFLVLYLIVRYYHKQKELKMALYKENLEKQQQEAIHQSQLMFFTNISHDFKTPISLIQATLDTLRNEGLKEYYYHILNNNSKRLLNLVNELMLFRTVENRKMNLQLQSMDVNSVIMDITRDFQEYAKQHQIDFKVNCDMEIPSRVPIDKNIFEKIIVNLLNNAFKFTQDGGHITVETYSGVNKFKSGYRDSFKVGDKTEIVDPFTIVIHDTGVGISKESISRIFERFYKMDTTDVNKHLGSGIGLALVKSLVLLHKGMISVYSEREKGSDMIVCLSGNPSTYAGERWIDEQCFEKKSEKTTGMQEFVTGVSETETQEKDHIFLREEKRIMVVEDNEDLRRLIVNYLSSYYDVVEAPDGLIAGKMLADMEIDLIISDIMMPFKDGITFCSEVKNDMSTSHIPFILLTAKTSVESKIEGTDSGADVYLDKPVNFDLLLLTVRNIFKHREQLKEYYAKNYFAETGELVDNQLNNKFLKQFVDILEEHIDQSDLDVNFIAAELSMSRSRLYSKIKSITGKSIVEFILSYRLKVAARLIREKKLTIREVMFQVGIESPSYFTRAFKKEFGETPTSFAEKQK